jgi:hypothetical protein
MKVDNTSDTVKDKLDKEIIKIEEDIIDIIPETVIKEIITIFKKIDTDMVPMIDLVGYLIDAAEDDKTKSLAIKRLLKYYGFCGSNDILATRQKLYIIDKTGKLGKKPFLKEKDKECINILLKQFGIYK